MVKKMTVLALAVGILAALALPSSASAFWRHSGNPIGEDVQLGLTGVVGFQSALGGIHCQVTSRVKFTAGQTTGHAETFTPHPTGDTANCSGQGGLAFCQIHNVTPTGMAPHATPTHPSGWTIHTSQSSAQTIEVTVGEIHSTPTGGFCPLERVTITPGTVLIHGEEQHVTNATLQGTLQAHLQTKGQAKTGEPHKFDGAVDTVQVQTTGTLQIENAAQRGTYTI